MILCAGLGTRLRPWTESHPKALVPVGGIPILRRVADRLMAQGYDEILSTYIILANRYWTMSDGSMTWQPV
ncbi:MAG: NTP transferase domain-containing protein [Muribaculaceae bacterium]|nr:NTP transferase domain-containing protein [Muribaculaceae bacterium]